MCHNDSPILLLRDIQFISKLLPLYIILKEALLYTDPYVLQSDFGGINSPKSECYIKKYIHHLIILILFDYTANFWNNLYSFKTCYDNACFSTFYPSWHEINFSPVYGWRYNFIIVFICIYLTISEIEYIFIFIGHFGFIYSVYYLSKIFGNFSIDFFQYKFERTFFAQGINSLSYINTYFPHFITCLLILCYLCYKIF